MPKKLVGVSPDEFVDSWRLDVEPLSADGGVRELFMDRCFGELRLRGHSLVDQEIAPIGDLECAHTPRQIGSPADLELSEIALLVDEVDHSGLVALELGVLDVLELGVLEDVRIW